MSDTRKFANQATPIMPPTTPSDQIRLSSCSSISISRQSSVNSPSLGSPAGKQSDLLVNNQAFIFSLHRDKFYSKHMAPVFVRFPNSYNFNSVGCKDGLGYTMSNKYTDYLKGKCATKEEYTAYSPINYLVNDIRKAGIDEAIRVNINQLILEQVERLIKLGVTTITYVGDFNSGMSGCNVTHMEKLIATLTSDNFAHQCGKKVKFINKKDNDFSTDVVFRAILDGTGGQDEKLSLEENVYTSMKSNEAFKKYNYDGLKVLNVLGQFRPPTPSSSLSQASNPSPQSGRQSLSPLSEYTASKNAEANSVGVAKPVFLKAAPVTPCDEEPVQMIDYRWPSSFTPIDHTASSGCVPKAPHPSPLKGAVTAKANRRNSMFNSSVPIQLNCPSPLDKKALSQ